MHIEQIFCSPDPKADPKWGWHNINNPRPPRFRVYCGRKRALRTQLQAQRGGYCLPYHMVALDLRESRLGAMLEENRRIAIMLRFEKEFIRAIDELSTLLEENEELHLTL